MLNMIIPMIIDCQVNLLETGSTNRVKFTPSHYDGKEKGEHSYGD